MSWVNITFPAEVERFADLQCNGKIADYLHCEDVDMVLNHFRKVQVPNMALEIGSGIGRVSVYLSKVLNWKRMTFALLDGDTGEEQIFGIHDNANSKHAYNSFRAMLAFCEANGIDRTRILPLNIASVWKRMLIRYLKGQKLGLVYSFRSIGFHWPANDYVRELTPLLAKGALLLFDTRSRTWERAGIMNRKSKISRERRVKFMERQLNGFDSSVYSVQYYDQGKRGFFILKKR